MKFKNNMLQQTLPQFWRDDDLPFMEARTVQDGRQFCYGKHAHDTFSIGVVYGGNSTYLNGRHSERLEAGATVLMNPADVHACNPCGNQAWAYCMLYVDLSWLTRLQHELGLNQNRDFQVFSARSSRSSVLYHGLLQLYALCTDPQAESLQKQSAAMTFFSQLHEILPPTRIAALKLPSPKLQRAADFINDNFHRTLKLDEICLAAEIPATTLIRAFKQQYGMTPHAYLTHRRIQFGCTQLKRGHAIAEVALAAGFADQAHFQRVFKYFLAATPKQYRG